MTYDYKQLCNELLSYLYQCDWPDGEKFYALVERTRAALAEPEPEVYYEFSVLNDEYCIEAGGTAPTLLSIRKTVNTR